MIEKAELRVVIIEDNPAWIEELSSPLIRWGFWPLVLTTYEEILEYMEKQKGLSVKERDRVVAFVVDGELPENGEVRDVGNRAIEMIRSNERYADTLVVSNTGGFSLEGADRVLDKDGNLIPELLVWINSTVSDVIKR